MKFIKLALISLVAFSILLWLFSLLFPGSTVLSRVQNMPGTAPALKAAVLEKRLPLNTWLVSDSMPGISFTTGNAPFYKWALFNGLPHPDADTIYFKLEENNVQALSGGIGLYQLTPDSVTTQLFLVFETPWYNPVRKLSMMLIDKQYGPVMEAALQRLYTAYTAQLPGSSATPEN